VPLPTADINPWLGGHLSRLGRGARVLDVGCGDGYWLDAMRAEGMCAVGLEPDPATAAEASVHGPVGVGDARRLPIADASVDLVWCIHILHHLDDPPAALAELRRVLRPGGHLLLAETVEDNPLIRTGRRLWPRWDDVPVASRFTAADVEAWLPEAGFTVSDWRQVSVVAHAAWLLPIRQRRTWLDLLRLEALIPGSTRWGAHVECVAS
jgi:ubiquinone/menaquinone biosynthesis C-methylase UbiE